MQIKVVPLIIFLLVFSLLNNSNQYQALNHDSDFDVQQLFPENSIKTSSMFSRPIQMQNDVMTWLEQSLNLSALLNIDFENGLLRICEATIAFSTADRTSNSSYFNREIFELFGLLISGEIQTDNYTLNRSTTGLYYIWDGVTGLISTKLNLYIAQALEHIDSERIANKLEIMNEIIISLNATMLDDNYPLLLRESVYIDDGENVIPSSLSELANLEEQLRFLEVIQYLLDIASNGTNQALATTLQALEANILEDSTGFLDLSVPMPQLEFGFLHSTINQVKGETYSDNASRYSLKNAYLLFDYFAKRSYDYSMLKAESAFDFYDMNKAQEYQDLLLVLLTDIQSVFRDEETGLYYSSLYHFNTTNLVEFGDELFTSDQFSLINVLTTVSGIFITLEGVIDFSVSPDQIQELYIDLWRSLEDAYIEVKHEGFGSTLTTTSSGFFYGFYSKNLGLFLFDNSTYGNLLIANLLALSGLGNIFPFQISVNYLDSLTTRDQQSLNIAISPVNQKNGFAALSDIYLNVPQENIDSLISQVTLSTQYNTTVNYNYSVFTEGTSQFILELEAKNTIFFTLESSYSVLKTLSIEAKFDPISPVQQEPLIVIIEVRDEVGIIKNNIVYNAKIQSSTLASPVWIINRSLYNVDGSKNNIIINTTQTNADDLTLYIIATKAYYYPAELNVTIRIQTKLNFLFEWLTWFIFQSEFGGYIGTASTLIALIFAFYSKVIRKILGKVKSCPYCGAGWETKFPVCSHCGRELNPIPSNLVKNETMVITDTSREDNEVV